jgi:lysozyme family protein
VQKIVGAEADGSIGPATVAAIKTMKPRDIIAEMTKRKLEFYKGLDDWPVFGRGWTNRAQAIEQAAVAIAAT